MEELKNECEEAGLTTNSSKTKIMQREAKTE